MTIPSSAPLGARGVALLVLGSAFPWAAAPGQAATSAGTSPSVSSPNSNVPPNLINYSISASESVVLGYAGTGGTSNSFNISGNAGWVSGSETHPTSFVYSGGYLAGNNGQPSSSFQNLAVSQVLTLRRWSFLASDLVSYLPTSPRFGLSGIPGVGDTGTLPIAAGVLPSDGVLSNYGRRLTNTVVGSASYQATGRTSLRSSGSFTKQFFLDGNGIENNQFNGSGELDHQFTRATTLGAAYNYGRFTYPGSGLAFDSQSVVAVYQHLFGPQFSMTASAGPQWTSSSQPALIPSRLGVAANFALSYAMGRSSYSLAYTRGTSGGSGVLLGAGSDTLVLSSQRHLSENWTGGLFASYGHVNTLTSVANLYTSANSFSLGAQASRRLGEHWSAFGSYSAQVQSVGQIVATENAFTGTAHIISMGITYAPQPLHLGRR